MENSLVLFLMCCSWFSNAVFTDHNGTRPLEKFPEGFLFGAASSAYQVEGGWNEGGKGYSIWDYFVNVKFDINPDNSTGAIACDSYHHYKRDAEMAAELGLDVYRFSISWTRILPFGTPDYVNPDGVQYYNNLINELIDKGVTPFVTIFHWDLPLAFHQKGGFLVDDIVNWYADYARIVFRLFGDRVKNWVTLNEPDIFCMYGYGYDGIAPFVHDPGNGYYDCVRNVLLANARAYHLYQNEFKSSQGGQVGLAVNLDWAMIKDGEDENVLLDYQAFHIGRYLDPIFSENGNYPQRFIDIVNNRSKAQGNTSSRLRLFSKAEIEYMKGTADFFGLNHYIAKYIYRNSSVDGMFEVPSFEDDLHVGWYLDPSWPLGNTPFMTDYAPAFHELLLYLKKTYPKMTIYVTENGAGTTTGLNDNSRVTQMRNYLKVLLQAIADGVNVRGYMIWSIMDNFQWNWGYTVRFGLYEVDFDHPNRTRTPRKSALVYKEIIKSRIVDDNYDPKSLKGRAEVTLTSCAILISLSSILLLSNLF